MSRKFAVIGVGNLLMMDDGIGIHVVEALRKEALPGNVQVFDASTRAFDVLEFMEGCDCAVVVDAYMEKGVPGTVYRFAFDPASGTQEIPVNLSMHDIDFTAALRAGQGSYNLPSEIVVIGIEPGILKWGIGLSPSLENAFPDILDAVRSELSVW